MSEDRLSNEDFFTRLTQLLTTLQVSAHGSIYLTQKRLSYQSSPDNEKDPLADLHPWEPLPILIRATDGKSKDKRAKKVKLSTVVQPDALEAFFTRYVDVCKAGMTTLKKRDRSGRKKAKAKKRKGAAAGATGGYQVAGSVATSKK